MSFTAPNTIPASSTADKTISNHSFFPDLSLLDFRTTMRVDTVTSDNRAENALYYAMLETNQRLGNWIIGQQNQGHASINDIPEKPGMPDGANKALYLRAVYSLAKGDLIEKYRDYDATNSGSKSADELTPEIADHRRNAAWAINDLAGKPRATIELI